MNDLHALLDQATEDVRPRFTAAHIERRVAQRARRRRIAQGAALAVVVLSAGAFIALSREPQKSRVTTRPAPATAARWSGRWLAIAFSAVGASSSHRSAEIRLDPGGVLRGFDGCGDVKGTWSTPDPDHLIVIGYSSSPGDSCEAGARTAATNLRDVLTSGAVATTPWDNAPDSMKLTSPHGFVGFVHDVAYRTPTDPAASGEIVQLSASGYDVVSDASAVTGAVLPAELRSVRFRSIADDREVSVFRTLGGMPFSQRGAILGSQGATATAVDVNGVAGVAVVAPNGEAGAVTWAPRDDITLSVRSAGATPEQLLGYARAVRYEPGSVRAAQLKVARSMGDAGIVMRSAEIAASGDVSGVPWKYAVYGDSHGTCAAVILAQGAAADCGDDTEPVIAKAVDVLGGRVVRGSVVDTAASVRIVMADGETIAAPASSLKGFPGRRYFAATIPRKTTPRQVVALGVAGEQVGSSDHIATGAAIGSG